eukprot:scaffold226392_cov25-Tisochrysis_lutea.AAC.1
MHARTNRSAGPGPRCKMTPIWMPSFALPRAVAMPWWALAGVGSRRGYGNIVHKCRRGHSQLGWNY